MCRAGEYEYADLSVSLTDLDSAIGSALFRHHMFPELSTIEEDEEETIMPRIPLLNPTTRKTLADTIFYLIKDDEAQYRSVLCELSELVPYDGSAEDGK